MDPTNTVPGDVTPEPILSGSEPSGQPVIDAGRDALIKKYEATYGGTPEPEAVTPEPVVAAAEPVQPVAGAVPDSNAILQSLVSELAALKAQLTPKPVEAAPVTQEDWLKLLADGKKSEGEKALAALLGPQIQEAAVQQALERISLERELDGFANKVRAENADILPMESYIAQAANARIQAAQAAGTIKTTADYVTVYKQAITAEIENARKLVQTFRGAGKQEAITRQTAVIASPTIKPNAVNMEREAPKTDTEPQVETPQDYMAKRAAMHARNSGLSS